MRIRLAHLMELVAGLALGIGYARYDNPGFILSNRPVLMFINDILTDVLAGVALASGVGMIVGSIRSRDPGGAWGIGRWTWALSALSLLASGIGTASTMAIDQFTEYHRVEFGKFLVDVTLAVAVNSSTSDLVRFLVVFLLTGLMARKPRPVILDYREWSGRIFGGLLLAWAGVVFVDFVIHPSDWVVF